jgi:hypothetical protein
VSEPLDGLAGVNGLGGIDADQADPDRLAVEADEQGIAIRPARPVATAAGAEA